MPGPKVLIVDDEPQIRRFLRASLQAQFSSTRDAGDAQVARVAHQGDLVDVDGQGGTVTWVLKGSGVHKLCKSIMSWRVRSTGLPQWYCSTARSWGLSSAATGAQARSVAV